jgi:carboxypeptidase T
MPYQHVIIAGRDRRELAALGVRHRIVVVAYHEDKKHGLVADAYVPPGKARLLEKRGYTVKLVEDLAAGDRKRLAERQQSLTRRKERGRYGDVIWGGGYFTPDEIDRAIELGVTNHGAYLERIELPHRTWEKRRCYAVRIGKGPRTRKRPAICLLGGVHGREWGSADILIYFSMRLLRAYRDRQDIRLGRKTFTFDQIRGLIERKDVLVFPQVNPDGRRYSMERQPMWRKNRRPAPAGCAARSIGVDINRNFPFLWDYERHFLPGTVGSSTLPSDFESYIGPRAASEPETRNVIWLLDQNPRIRYLVDLHSYGETILYSWGTDANQGDDPQMSFLNRAFDGMRGRPFDQQYREYMPPQDEATTVELGRCMAAAIRRVRGRDYKVKQSIGLYPTAGSSDDYAYSRHMVDPGKLKIIAFTMEWGRSHAVTPFHPPYPEMRKVMREVTAGLLEFCLVAD